jgi:uncharacterized Tic20 family protein
MATDPTPVAPSTPEISSTPDERNLAMFCHIGGALFSFIVPLIIWVIKKDQSKFVDDQGKEALNFQITILIGHVVAGFTICFTVGILNAALYVATIVFGILGGIAAQKGQVYRYPFSLRLIK